MAGNAANVKHGPGWLYFAPANFDETALTAPDVDLTKIAALIPVGYTEDGSTFSATPKFDDIEVAEELDPLDVVATGREMSVSFNSAEVTAANIAKAFNGGTITTAGGAVTFEPPAADAPPARVGIVWQSFAKDELWLYRQCIQTGAAKMDRKKGSSKTTIPMEFRVLKPNNGKAPFKFWMEGTATADAVNTTGSASGDTSDNAV